MLAKKVLLIDDDPDFLHLTGHVFKKAGAQVITAHNSLEGINKIFAHRPDLIILDIMMPGKNGFETCKKIRQFTTTPLIMLSALNQEHDLLQSLEAGADVFLSKPFNPEVLLARARAVMRRSSQGDGYQAAFNYDDGRLKIDFEKQRVHFRDKQIKLTRVEFRLLAYLASNSGRVLSFEQILTNVWGSAYEGNKDYVHVYISNLRSKIERDASSPRYIHSVHGVGYSFEKQSLIWPSSGKYKIVPSSMSESIGD